MLLDLRSVLASDPDPIMASGGLLLDLTPHAAVATTAVGMVGGYRREWYCPRCRLVHQEDACPRCARRSTDEVIAILMLAKDLV